MQPRKVVTATEMARIEKLAYEAGASPETFMEDAGGAIAVRTEEYVHAHNLLRKAVLLVGKGNNGGDAYVAGRKLLEKGFSVEAYHFFPPENCSSLCQQNQKRFEEAGGKIDFIAAEEERVLPADGVILDGLVGTGFQGKAEGVLAKAIEMGNRAGAPILAIDIPSGLNGDTGAVETVAIHARATIYLGLAKLGFFIEQGWNFVGELIGADYGLALQFINDSRAEAELFDERILPFLLPPLIRNRHKYERGYLLAIAGSAGMGGAALLCAGTALRAGAGIVRLFHGGLEEGELGSAPLELLKEGIDLERIFQEEKRAHAYAIGPGLGRDSQSKKLLKTLLRKLALPAVLDADALYHLSKNPRWSLPKKVILTPHHGEMERFCSPTLAHCQHFVEKKGVTLVLKGAPSMIFHPGRLPLIVAHGDPGMATAGAGDVLTGIIGALLAQQLESRSAAILGVALHALAGESAAKEKTSYCVMASDLTSHLPKVIGNILGTS